MWTYQDGEYTLSVCVYRLAFFNRFFYIRLRVLDVRSPSYMYSYVYLRYQLLSSPSSSSSSFYRITWETITLWLPLLFFILSYFLLMNEKRNKKGGPWWGSLNTTHHSSSLCAAAPVGPPWVFLFHFAILVFLVLLFSDRPIGQESEAAAAPGRVFFFIFLF